jgi:hypothetical protein
MKIDSWIMKGWKLDYRTADSLNGAIHNLGEQNFL